MSRPLLRVEDLSVSFPAPGGGRVPVVRGLSLELERGSMVGLVGESGCGKTMTALALMRLLPRSARITGGRAWLAPPAGDAGTGEHRTGEHRTGEHSTGEHSTGEDLLALPEEALRRRRGRRLAMVFQEPATALNPVLTVGRQVVEAVRAHRPLSRGEARRRAVELLERVALPDAEGRLDAYPHQLSGGQRQRVVIAMALASGPDLLLADEPTTALDVTVQAQILELLARLRRELGLTVLLITHDLAVVAETCERVVVMYAGQVVEEAGAEELFRRPAHPYTRALLAALPRLGRPVPRGELPTVPGRVPEPSRLPSGCAFHPRCGEVLPVCPERVPDLYAVPAGGGPPSRARCFLHGGPDGDPSGDPAGTAPGTAPDAGGRGTG